MGPAQLHLSLSDQIEIFWFFILLDDLLGNGEGEWFGVVDDELELVGQQFLEERALAEHLCLLEVYALLIALYHLLEVLSVDRPYDSVVALSLSHQCSLLPMNEFCLSEALPFGKRVDFFILVLDALVEVGSSDGLLVFFEYGHAEWDVSFNHHVDGRGDFALIVDDGILAVCL